MGDNTPHELRMRGDKRSQPISKASATVRLVKDFLWFFAIWGLVAGAFRMWFGLGATTNLSDPVPWGLWKVLNMVAGVALSTSGFTVGFLVYVLRIERFRPLVKPAILVAFLGYGCSCTALLFDIGLPQRFWHPLVMWNEHSFLFEVFWCVMLYFTVTTIELLPTVLERFRTERIVKFLHGVSFGVVVVGISLSSLHHSSLGSLFLVTPLRLHELWYSPLLPFFFILSAMGGGLMLLVLLKILYARWFDPDSVFGTAGASCTIDLLDHPGSARPEPPAGKDMPMLRNLATIGVSIMGVYLALKLYDLLARGGLEALMAGTWESWLYGFELILTAVVPMLLVFLPQTRRSPLALGMAGFTASAGVAINRMDVGIFGYYRDAGSVYFPSLAEWAVGIGVIAAAGLVFLAVVENFSVFDDNWRQRREDADRVDASFDSFSRIWNRALQSGLRRVSLIVVVALPVAWMAMYPPFADAESSSTTVRPPLAKDAEREVLRLDGDRSGVVAIFPHADHKERLGGEASCVICHHINLPHDHSSACSSCHRDMYQPTRMFDHFAHMDAVANEEGLSGWYGFNQSCSFCHTDGRPRSADSAKECFECHKDDMWLTGKPDEKLELAAARSYQDAMHTVCVDCHEKEAGRVNRPGLQDCSTCHESLRNREMLELPRPPLPIGGSQGSR